MASFYSKPADYGTYTQPINLELVNFVMQSRQQKFDYNLAKVESKVADQLGSLDLVRTEDKEYFLNRAQDVLGSMGNLSKLDWSKNGVTRQIDNQIDSVVDDRVLNDVVSSKNFRNFQRTVQQKQADGKGAYSETNVAYAMENQGANAWLKGESNSLGSVKYQDFHDVSLELKDISENLDKYARDIKRIDGKAGDMYFVSTEGKRLSSAEVRNVAESLLSDKAKDQMKINGWAHYDAGTLPKEEIASNFKANIMDVKDKYYQDKIDVRLEKIKALNGTKPDQAKILNEEIGQLKTAKNKTQSQYNTWMEKGMYSNMTTAMEYDNVLGKFANTFAIENTVQEYIKNDYKYAEYTEQLSRATKLEVEKMKAMYKTGAKSKTKGINTGDGIQQVPSMQGQLEENPYELLTTEIENRTKGFDTAYNSLMQAVPSKLLTKLEKDYETAVAGGEELNKKDWMVTTLKAMEDSERGSVSIQAIAQADFAMKILNGKVQDKMKYDDRAFAEEEARVMGTMIEDIVEGRTATATGTNALMIDESGNKVSVVKYLKSKGITSNEDLNANPEAKKQFLKAFYTDKMMVGDKSGVVQKMSDAMGFARGMLWDVLTKGAGPTGAATVAGAASQRIFEETNELRQTTEVYKDRLIDLFQEEGMTRKEATEKAGGYFNRTQEAIQNRPAPERRPGQVIDSPQDSYTNLSTFSSGDRLTRESVESRAKQAMNREKYSPVSDAIIFNKTTAQAVELTDLINSGEVFNPGGVTASKQQPITLRDNGDETVSARYMIRDKKTGAYGFKTSIIPKASLPQSVTSTVDFSLTTPAITYDSLDTFTSSVDMVDPNNTKRMADIAKTIGIPYEQVQMMATKDGVMGTLHMEYPQIIGMPGQANELGQAIASLLDSDRLDIKMEKVDDLGAFVPSLVYHDPEGGETKLATMPPIPNNELEYQYKEVSYGAPMKVADFFRDMLHTVIRNGGASNSAIEEIIKINGRRATTAKQ